LVPCNGFCIQIVGKQNETARRVFVTLFESRFAIRYALAERAGNIENTASVFFSLYLQSQLRIAVCERRRGEGAAEKSSGAIKRGLTTRHGNSGWLGLGKKRHCTTQLSALVALCLLAGCSGIDKIGIVDPRYGVSSSARLVALGEPVPKGGGVYRVGVPYSIGGRTYVPAEDPHYRAEGLASWYGEDFHGRQTANGEIFDMNSVSAAHATLPMPSYVRVTNVSNHRSVIVRVNDRGPYHADRIIDVSVKTAILLGFYTDGVAPVRVEYVSAAPLEGSEDNMLIATLRQGEPAPAPSLVRVATARKLPWNVPVPSQRPYSLGEGQASTSSPLENDAPSVFRASAVEYDKPVTARIRPAVSAYAPALPDRQTGDLAQPALMPAANARSLY
jgi:rare lipoprotein A